MQTFSFVLVEKHAHLSHEWKPAIGSLRNNNSRPVASPLFEFTILSEHDDDVSGRAANFPFFFFIANLKIFFNKQDS